MRLQCLHHAHTSMIDVAGRYIYISDERTVSPNRNYISIIYSLLFDIRIDGRSFNEIVNITLAIYREREREREKESEK